MIEFEVGDDVIVYGHYRARVWNVLDGVVQVQYPSGASETVSLEINVSQTMSRRQVDYFDPKNWAEVDPNYWVER